MDDATLGSGIAIIGFSLGITPLLLLIWFGRWMLIDVFFWLCRNPTPASRFLRGGVSLFVGLMLSIAVGVFVPKVLTPAAHLLCNGRIEVASQNYSYKPGQRGTNVTMICAETNGRQTKITIASIFLSALLVGAALFVLMELIGLMSRAFWHDPPTPKGRSSTVSGPPHNASSFESSFQGTDAQNRSGRPTVIVNGKPIDPGSDDLIERLQKLKTLHDTGLIDADEYEVKKKDILNAL